MLLLQQNKDMRPSWRGACGTDPVTISAFQNERLSERKLKHESDRRVYRSGCPRSGNFLARWIDGSNRSHKRLRVSYEQSDPQRKRRYCVAFFPLDRFLTPGLKKIFIDSPAVFFLPAATLVDGKIKPQGRNMLATVAGQELSAKSLNDPKVMDIFNGISMNRMPASCPPHSPQARGVLHEAAPRARGPSALCRPDRRRPCQPARRR